MAGKDKEIDALNAHDMRVDKQIKYLHGIPGLDKSPQEIRAMAEHIVTEREKRGFNPDGSIKTSDQAVSERSKEAEREFRELEERKRARIVMESRKAFQAMTGTVASRVALPKPTEAEIEAKVKELKATPEYASWSWEAVRSMAVRILEQERGEA